MRVHQYHRTDPSALYRLYDQADVLIYTGISFDPHTRILRHRREQPWGAEIARFTVEWYDDRASCEAAEARLIRSARPKYNTSMGHSGHTWPVTESRHNAALAEVVTAYNLIEVRERRYREVLRRALDAGTARQVDVANALGRTREMIRRDAMTDDERARLAKRPALNQ